MFFFAIFKGNNFSDFLFASLVGKALPEGGGLLSKERICSKEQILSFKS